jgi:predicted  nucleic acid-binding Zn-ribbon protein
MRTGRENRTVFSCRQCGWESEVHEGTSIACVNGCGNCGKYGLIYTRWEAGVEDAAARAAIDALKPALA